jgi:hypothetical protein
MECDMKEMIPQKLIATLNEDGTLKNAVLQYKLKIDGVLQSKFYTIAVSDGIKAVNINTVFTDAISHAKKGEKI